MSLADLGAYAGVAALSALLAWAAISDVRRRKIPNAIVVAVLALFAIWTVAGHGHSLVDGLTAFAVAFAVSYGLYAANIVGAGDAKLFSSVALFVGVAYLPAYALATALAGGGMAVVSLASRPMRALAIWQLRRRGDSGRGIPYGVAIATGAILVMWGKLLGYASLLSMWN